MDSHIAWDIGVAALGAALAEGLDAAFIRQTYSRLVIDCNRAPGVPESVPAMSDGVTIAGNLGLTASDIAARQDEIYAPYHARIAALLDERGRRGQATWLVSLHSFTPVFRGAARPWRYGVLHRGDSALSRRVLSALREAVGEDAGDNQPYAMDATDNTIPLHADAHGLDYLELEVRQDLIAEAAGQRAIAAFIGDVLPRALAE